MQASTLLAITIRVCIALLTRTYFQPDEYFQSLEPAHHLVFGYGLLTWEWKAFAPIRSVFYPLLNVPVFWILKITGLSESGTLGDSLLIVCPKLLHGLLGACTDIYLAELTRRAIGSAYTSSALLFSLTSFFHALALSRSLSNSLETSLTTIAFAHYPWDASSNTSVHLIYNRTRLRTCILFSALGCMVRPTNAVIWVFLYANLLWAVRHHRRVALWILQDIASIATFSCVFLFILDSVYYGKPTFTPVNFLRTNLSPVSLFYGANPWHYYITQGIPILCTTALPFALHGMWKVARSPSRHDIPLRTMLATVLWSTGIYSLGGHKEWRFLHPILPLFHVYAAKSLVELCSKSPKRQDKVTSNSRLFQRRTYLARFNLPDIPTKYLSLIFLTLPASLYVIIFYCDAPISVLSYFRALPRNELGHSTMGFLMPCHSTPGLAYLHRQQLADGGSWALGCEPPLQNQGLAEYEDQTEVFFGNPRMYLETYFPKAVNPLFPPSPWPASVPGMPSPRRATSGFGPRYYPWKHEWPRHLVFFGNLLQQEGIEAILKEKGYKEVWRAGREWEGEGTRLGGVQIWKWFT